MRRALVVNALEMLEAVVRIHRAAVEPQPRKAVAAQRRGAGLGGPVATVGDEQDLRGCDGLEHAHMIGRVAKAHIGPGYKVPQAACAARPASSNAVRAS